MGLFGRKKPDVEVVELEEAHRYFASVFGSTASPEASAASSPKLCGTPQQAHEAIKNVPGRGKRFSGDNDNIVFFIERSKNANVVCYECNLEESGALRLDAYWLDLEPSYQEKARAKGKMNDREELNIVEKKMAYGYSCNKLDDSENEMAIQCKFVAVPSRIMLLLLHPGSPKILLCKICDMICVIEKAYVKAAEPKHMLSLPSVEYVELFGTSLVDGKYVTEKIFA